MDSYIYSLVLLLRIYSYILEISQGNLIYNLMFTVEVLGNTVIPVSCFNFDSILQTIILL